MSGVLARAVMLLASRSMGSARREWAFAMQAEFGAAAAEGKAFSFALGCLIAAWREMPFHREGRLSLASHAIALGFLVPIAAIQFLFAGGLAYSERLPGQGDPVGIENAFLGGAQLAASPFLLVLWLALGAAHLRLAWFLLERDWARVFRTGAMIVAATATLAIYMSVLFLEDARLALQVAMTLVELGVIAAAARWYDQSGMFAVPEELA